MLLKDRRIVPETGDDARRVTALATGTSIQLSRIVSCFKDDAQY
ncbi:MAG TPA: hypothetical protein VGD65_07345 [Chryseosolibacter sp.]